MPINNSTACGLAQEEAKFQQALECKSSIAWYMDFADHVQRLEALYKAWKEATVLRPFFDDDDKHEQAIDIDFIDAPDKLELQVDVGAWRWSYQILKPGHKETLTYRTRMTTTHGAMSCHDLRDPSYKQVEDIVEALLTFTRHETFSES